MIYVTDAELVRKHPQQYRLWKDSYRLGWRRDQRRHREAYYKGIREKLAESRKEYGN